MWRTDELNLFPDNCGKKNTGNNFEDRYSHIEKNTQSMFCPSANVIKPLT